LLNAGAMSAILRTWREHHMLLPFDDDTFREAAQRLWQWTSALDSALGPLDWQLWLRDTLQVETDLHSGTAGVVDEGFYTTLHDYLKRHYPPAEVCDVVLFREGLGRWDFTAVVSAAGRLQQSVLDGAGWIDPDHFRDGVVIAKLFLGDVAGAREDFVTLASQVDRSERHLRTRLLKAYLEAPEKLPERPALNARVPWTCSAAPTADSPPVPQGG
jgi:hypothetical protein